MSRYAAQTHVSSERSRAEIEQILMRYGATGFIYGWQEGRAIIGFQMNKRRIQFDLPMPDKNSKEFTQTPSMGYARKPEEAIRFWEQATRQRWRALALAIKAKLEAVSSGITEFEEEFLAHIVLPNGDTVGKFMTPQIAEIYETKQMPKLLGAK